jgi:Glycosyl hydrolase family 12
MRPSFVGFVLGSLFAFGCATPATQGNPGSGGNSSSGNGGSSSSGSGGSSSSGSGGSSSSGSGGSSSSGSGGSSTSSCTPNPAELINSAGWNCDLNTSIGIQGAVYGYTDGSSCASPQPANICGSGGCCINGTTVVDSTSTKWGCGIGVELNDSGGTSAVKSQYTGPVQCFNITLTGSSGGNEVRIGFTQKADNSNTVAPFVSIAAFTSGWTGKICFSDANCPSWATTTQCSKSVGSAGTPYDMQIQVSAGQTTSSVGTYNVCVSSIAPVTSSSTGTGGSGGGGTCTSPSGSGTITDQFGTGVVGCGSKEYIVQNNEWGSTAGQTITYGPGANFKVTVQKGTGSGNNPEGFPSVFTGANSNHNTGSSSMLPRAVSSIAKGGVMTSMTWADNGATGSYNAAYDVWFSTGSGGDPSSSSPSGGFLMVWYHMPSSNQPIGTSMASATIGGKNWNVWYGNNSGNGKPCVSYVAQTSINSLTFSLGDFIQDAVTRGYVQSSWYLTNVFAGFEIWNGGVGLAVTDFSVNVP